MAAIDSEALFRSKCQQLKLPENAITKLVAKGWSTHGTFAFCCPGEPGRISEAEFKSAVADPIVGTAVEHTPKLRRLHFESYALTAAELKRTAEANEGDTPRKIPAVELASRYDQLQARLKPPRIVDKLEPSQALVNLASSMLDEGKVRYVEWSKCTCRSQEVNSIKEDATMKVLQGGKAGEVRVVDPESKLTAATHSDLEIFQALRRRGIAYNLAAIMTFEKHELLVDLLFAEYQREPPAGFAPISISQLQQADREVHVRMAEHTRAGLTPSASGGLPLDDPLDKVLASTAVHWLLQPRQKSAAGARAQDGPTQPKPKPQPKKKVKAEDKVKDSQAEDAPRPPKKKQRKTYFRMPKPLIGGVPKDDSGSNICFDHNLGQCTPGVESCPKGRHVCCAPGCFSNSHIFSQHS